MAGKWSESNVKRDEFGRFVSGSAQIARRNRTRRFIGGTLKQSSVWRNGRRVSYSQTIVNDRSNRVQTRSTSTSRNGRRVSGNSFMHIEAVEPKRGSKFKVVHRNGKRVKDTRKGI